MVGFLDHLQDVVLFYAEQDLLCSVAQWACRHDRYPLRLISSSRPEDIHHAVTQAAYVIIDATAEPGKALETLEAVMAANSPATVLVYTKAMHPDLELDVRRRGIGFVLGPLDGVQWEGLLESVEASQVI